MVYQKVWHTSYVDALGQRWRLHRLGLDGAHVIEEWESLPAGNSHVQGPSYVYVMPPDGTHPISGSPVLVPPTHPPMTSSTALAIPAMVVFPMATSMVQAPFGTHQVSQVGVPLAPPASHPHGTVPGATPLARPPDGTYPVSPPDDVHAVSHPLPAVADFRDASPVPPVRRLRLRTKTTPALPQHKRPRTCSATGAPAAHVVRYILHMYCTWTHMMDFRTNVFDHTQDTHIVHMHTHMHM